MKLAKQRSNGRNQAVCWSLLSCSCTVGTSSSRPRGRPHSRCRSPTISMKWCKNTLNLSLNECFCSMLQFSNLELFYDMSKTSYLFVLGGVECGEYHQLHHLQLLRVRLILHLVGARRCCSGKERIFLSFLLFP